MKYKQIIISSFSLILFVVLIIFLLSRQQTIQYSFVFSEIHEAKEFYGMYIPAPFIKGQSLEKIAPILAANVPLNMDSLKVEDKTALFIAMLLPNIIAANQKIEQERQAVVDCFNKKKQWKKLSWKEEAYLRKTFEKYKVKGEDLELLLYKLDTIPVSLALAQAIIESGWGTSRFAVKGNSLYGVHLSSKSDGDYMVSKYNNVKVATYDTILQGTQSYMQLLNTGGAYKGLRDKRAAARSSNSPVNGFDLADTLLSYSERGWSYVRSLRSVMKRYELEKYNVAKLDEGKSQVSVKFN